MNNFSKTINLIVVTVIAILAIISWGMSIDKGYAIGYAASFSYLLLVTLYFFFVVRSKAVALAFFLLAVHTGLTWLEILSRV